MARPVDDTGVLTSAYDLGYRDYCIGVYDQDTRTIASVNARCYRDWATWSPEIIVEAYRAGYLQAEIDDSDNVVFGGEQPNEVIPDQPFPWSSWHMQRRLDD